MFRNRSVVEIMVLTFTFLIAGLLVSVSFAITFIEIRDPSVDTTSIVDTMTTIMGTIVGALMGLLAGKNESLTSHPEDDKHESDTKSVDTVN